MGEAEFDCAARCLVGSLGPSLVAALAGIKDANRFRGRVDDLHLDAPEAERILFAHEVWQSAVGVNGADVTRAWFIGANPWLGDVTVLTAVREGRFGAVRIALEALIEDSSGW